MASHAIDLDYYRDSETFLEGSLVPEEGDDDVILLEGLTTIDQIRWHQTQIRIGTTVELHDGTFLQISDILRDFSNASGDLNDVVSLRGYHLVRTSHASIQDMLPKKLNELCLMAMMPPDLIVPPENQPDLALAYITRQLADIICIRDVVFTNVDFPAYSFRSFRSNLMSNDQIREQGKLVCRWLQIRATKPKIRIEIVRIPCGLCTTACGLNENELRSSFLHLRSTERQRRLVDVDLSEDVSDDYHARVPMHQTSYLTNARRNTITRPARYYAYGEVCAGGGGVTAAAQELNLQMKFLLDNWDIACKTLRLNFGPQVVVQDSIHNFCTERKYRYLCHHVDVLWISYPCQPHSAAHTRPGRNDERNLDAVLATIPLIRRLRPRLIHFEQVEGFWNRNGGTYFKALFNDLTSEGYSVRFTILDASEYGDVQKRHRVVIHAAAPGQVLASFPARSHGPQGSGLFPFKTIRDILRFAPKVKETPPHMARSRACDEVPYDAGRTSRINTILKKGDIVHPSGRRYCNLQEMAMLAGFRRTHEFPITGIGNIREIIGNGVPFSLAHEDLKQALVALKKSDDALAPGTSFDPIVL